MIDRNKNTPAPTPQDEHDHPDGGHHDGHDCPEHYHRCYTRTVSYGYQDCPDVCCPEPEPEPVTKTTMLHVPCGVENPEPQISAHLALPANVQDKIIQVIDLGHKGWLVFFLHNV